MDNAFLVTGGAGFIGSNFIVNLLKEDNEHKVINLDNLTYAANLDNLSTVQNHPRYQFVRGDISDRKLVESLFNQFSIRGVFHFAAETHVDNSISGPEVFINTNVHGAFTVLDVARLCWMEEPGVCKKEHEHSRFLYVSTDEVFGSLGDDGYFTETTAFAPNSPYSASKAAADMLVRSYHKTYGMNTVITNCSNNYGPRQHVENFIPLIIYKALNHEPIPIFGDGLYVRDWLYVNDHCSAIKQVFDQAASGESYNIGSNNEKENLWIVDTICNYLNQIRPVKTSQLNSYRDLITFVKDRPGHDRRYAIDSTKLQKELGWQANTDLETGLEETVNWYVRKWDEGNFPGVSR